MQWLVIFLIFASILKDSDCTDLFDLNVDDENSLDAPDVYFINERTGYVLNISLYNSTFIGSEVWDNISVVTLENGVKKGTVTTNVGKAFDDNRLSSDSKDFAEEFLTESDDWFKFLNDLLPKSIFRGYLYYATGEKEEEFVEQVFNSLMFEFHADTDFEPRTICIIAVSGDVITTGCVNITYIGENDHRPDLKYVPVGTTVFEEGTTVPVLVINGNITITDQDHPSYLLKSMKIELKNPDADYETLAITGYENYTYDKSAGLLEIATEETPEFYEELLQSLTYINLNPEPDLASENREIKITVSDGQIPNPSTIINLIVINTNDAPNIEFSGNQIDAYNEGDGSMLIDSGLNITDSDPNPFVTNVTIELFSKDDEYETLSINASLITLNIEQDGQMISIDGNSTLQQYSQLLRTLVYEHNDSNPGNPTEGERVILFSISDGVTTNEINFTFSVVPRNDKPLLIIVEDPSSDSFIGKYNQTYTYLEDDPQLFFASNVYLQDVDSDLSSVTIKLTGLLNGDDDVFKLNETLLSYDVSKSNQGRIITLSGDYTADVYEKVLRSLSYVNNLMNDSIVSGIRNISIQAMDVYGFNSEQIDIFIDVQTRNDEPELIVNDMLQFTEGSTSIEIATPHMLALMDEEKNGISELCVTLNGVNGPLDEDEFLILRTTQTRLLDSLVYEPRNICTTDEGSVEDYEDFLRSIRYINQEDEPSYYVNGSKTRLVREIVVKITDNGSIPSTATHRIEVMITLVNDNKPLISINVVNSSCIANHPFTEASRYSKRDTDWISRLHKRLQNNRRKNTPGLAPNVVIAYAQVSKEDSCISNITVNFSADTSAPPVETRRDLAELVSFVPKDINPHIGHGRWTNLRSLVVYLTDCYKSENQSGLKIIFESWQGDQDCNAKSLCTKGICFRNSTGCPIAGFSSILSNVTTPISTKNDSTDPFSSQESVLPYVGILLAFIVIIMAFICGAKLAIDTRDKDEEKVGSEEHSLSEFSEVKCSIDIEVQTLIPNHEEQPQHKTEDESSELFSLNQTGLDTEVPVCDQEKTTCVPLVVKDTESVVQTNDRVSKCDCQMENELSRREHAKEGDSGEIRTLAQLDSKDR